jgi:hypothetical protein
MQPTTISIRRLVPTVILALVFAAFGSGAAGAAGASDGKAPVQAKEFVPGVTDFPSRLGEAGERAAEARLAQLSQQQEPVTLVIDESGFDWGAGATGAVAATLLLFGAALAVRTAKRSRVALG